MNDKPIFDNTTDVNACRSILFLDFDGVCNSFEIGSCWTHGTEDYGSDPRIIKRIKRICRDSDASVVISSNWRKFGENDSYTFNGKILRNPLPKLYRELGGLVIGTLTRERHLRKAEALELWMEDNPSFKGRYAIVDDDTAEGFLMNPRFRKSFWLTDRKHGLTEKTAKEITNHLRGN